MSNEVDLEQEQMREIIADFIVEADELVANLDGHFVELESKPRDPELLNEIFRAVHTIKGTSSFLGLDQVTLLSHRIEDVLNKLRRSTIELTTALMDVLLEAVDILKTLLDQVRNDAIRELDLTVILNRLVALADGETPSGDDSADSVGNQQVSDSNSGGRRRQEASTVRVEVARLDALMNLVGELVLSRNSLLQVIGQVSVRSECDRAKEELDQAARGIDLATAGLQAATMRMRMLPIGKVFGRFPRQIRDLSRELGKKIRLVTSGEQTELDKSVVDEIGDPLMHIIRNSCDHGLERPEERTSLGKPIQGTIWLDAAQVGSSIVITVRDDGRGFDVDAIKSKILAHGIAGQGEIDLLTEDEILGHVFGAGFSTAAQVTDVSGRGVGMDVVRANVERLNGSVELASVAGKGSCVTVRLPLTLAIIQGLLVESLGEILILPMASVTETVRLDRNSLATVNQRPVLRIRDEVIPLADPAEVLGRAHDPTACDAARYAVVLNLGRRKIGLPIARFLGQEEVVIKPLGDYLGAGRGISGAAILGDGRVRLIVDVAALFRRYGGGND